MTRSRASFSHEIFPHALWTHGTRIAIKAAFVLEKIYYFKQLYNFFATTTIEQSVNDEKKIGD